MNPPEYLYVASGTTVHTRVYHTGDCNGRMANAHRWPADEQTVDMLRKLGYSPCKTCKLRYEKHLKRQEHAAILKQYSIAALAVPDEFELRVYWHRESGQPVEIWNSRIGMKG